MNSRFILIRKYRIYYILLACTLLIFTGILIYMRNFGVLIIWGCYSITMFLMIKSYTLTKDSLEIKNVILKNSTKSIPYAHIEGIEFSKNRKQALRNVRIHYLIPTLSPGNERRSWIDIRQDVDLDLFLQEIQSVSGVRAVER